MSGGRMSGGRLSGGLMSAHRYSQSVGLLSNCVCCLQVTGELSNNGQPMRRFMQTFVLVSQSSKHYYVHNDIFRYQDEVFHDNDTEPDVSDDAAGLASNRVMPYT